MILLAAWPGPRPVVHSHSDYVSQSNGDILLAQHVSLYHECNAATVHGDNATETHIHWLFCWTALDGRLLLDSGDATVDVATTRVDAGGKWERGFSCDLGFFAWLGVDPLLSVKPIRQAHGHDSTRIAPNGLAFHQQFCTWTC